MKKFCFAFVLIVFVLSACTTPFPTAEPVYAQAEPTITATPVPTGLLGEYFSNLTVAGAPQIVRIDPTIDFDWEGEAPDEHIMNNFSVRWIGYLVPSETAEYIITINADDGARLWISDMPLTDDWSNPTLSTHTLPALNLVAGARYPIKIEMYDNNGGARIQLNWRFASEDEDADHPIPSAVLMPPDGPMPPTTHEFLDTELCVEDLFPEDTEEGDSESEEPTIIWPGTADDLAKKTILSSAFVGELRSNTYRIAVIPVGYTPEEMQERYKNLQTVKEIYQQYGMQISYTYLFQQLPIGVYADGPTVDEETLRLVKTKTWEVLNPQPHIFVLDIKNIDGNAYVSRFDDQLYIVLSLEDTHFKMLHELAHIFGLNDGYQAHQYLWSLTSNNTEFFVQWPNGTIPKIPELQTWIDIHQTKFVQSQYTCQGYPVYKLLGAEESIMSTYYRDEILINGKVNPAAFTDFQVWVMQTTLAKILADRP